MHTYYIYIHTRRYVAVNDPEVVVWVISDRLRLNWTEPLEKLVQLAGVNHPTQRSQLS